MIILGFQVISFVDLQYFYLHFHFRLWIKIKKFREVRSICCASACAFSSHEIDTWIWIWMAWNFCWGFIYLFLPVCSLLSVALSFISCFIPLSRRTRVHHQVFCYLRLTCWRSDRKHVREKQCCFVSFRRSRMTEYDSAGGKTSLTDAWRDSLAGNRRTPSCAASLPTYFCF